MKTYSYPSVSKVLDAISDKTGLEEWRKRIGDKEADRIVNQSLEIGRFIDKMMEAYFKKENLPIPTTDNQKIASLMFKSSLIDLNNLVKRFVFQEEKVVSHKLRIQGRFDLIGINQSDDYILIDFKNSKKEKPPNFLEGYITQVSFYKQMILETFGINIKKVYLFILLRNMTTQLVEVDIMGMNVLQSIMEKYEQTTRTNS